VSAPARHAADDAPGTAPLPTSFTGYLRSFGPGFVAVLTWLGSGDIVSAGVSGGNYGYALMWALVLAIGLRFFFVSTIAKYQLCNPRGEGVLDGLARLHPAFAPFLLLVALLVGHVNGAYLAVGLGEISVGLTGAGRVWQWACFWALTALWLAFRPEWQHVERVFKLLLALLSASLLGTALWVGPDPAGVARGVLALELPARVGPFDALLVSFGMVGAVGGSLMNLVYPYFLEQRGWRGPRFRRIQSYDFALAIAVMIAFDLAVWTLGAELVHERGGRIEDLDDLTGLLGAVLGPGGRVLFLLGVFAAVYTSVLGSGLGLGLLASHAWQRWRSGEPPAPSELRAHPAYRAVAAWVLLSPLAWTALAGADFVSLTLLASALAVLLVPALAGGLWWITASARFVGEQYRNRWWENALLGLLFALALWATGGAVESLVGAAQDLVGREGVH
jgi:Mn2+/Fe2+ NRAMP family transporter